MSAGSRHGHRVTNGHNVGDYAQVCRKRQVKKPVARYPSTVKPALIPYIDGGFTAVKQVYAVKQDAYLHGLFAKRTINPCLLR